MIVSIIALVFGFFLLIKGADIFVDGASSTASNFKVSKMLIGLTIVAFGTSAPEFAVSMQALATHKTDMVLGNVIGSCILNTLLILGIAAMINPIKIKDNTVRKELPIALLISTLLAVLMLDIKLNNSVINQITRSDAIVILLFFSVFLYYLINLAKQKKEEKKEEKPKYGLIKSFIFVGIGLAGIIIGSDLVVKHASNIAEAFGISERVISLTIIALGTSLPELVTTIVASSKGEQDLLLGNIIGSNIFNICVVLGIPVAIFGTITPSSFTIVDLVALVGSAFVLFLFALTKKKINRFEGFLMFVSFLAYYLLLIIF
jgi:cation:H+ antiporter